MASRLRESLLWAGAAAGLLSIVAAVAVTFFGFTFLIFRSGSMGPDIPTGSLALARTVPAAGLHQGDVVSVIAYNGDRITHRVVSTTLRGDGAALVLQGDANGVPDEEIYLVTGAEREIFSLPYAGYGVTVLLSPAGLVAAACLAAMALLLGFDRPETGTQKGGRHRKDSPPRPGRRLIKVGAAASTVVMLVGTPLISTQAAFQDTATLTSGTFTAAASFAGSPPTNVRCTSILLVSDTISWNAPTGPAPTGYRLYYTGADTGFRDYPAGTTSGTPPIPTQNGNRDYNVTVAAIYNGQVSAPSTTSANIRGRRDALLANWTCN